jgi:hypothetical protein
LYIENVSDYSKKDIDNGHTPLDIYQMCSIIRESFCCSYSIRKNNILYLYVAPTQILIKIDGSSLRYLGSDERSQALLLKRALDNVNRLGKLDSQRWQKSTPGIFVKRLLNSESILENIIDLYKELDNLMEYCYIFPFPQNSRIIEDFLGRIEERYKIDYVNLAKIRGIENKILYVNFLIDQKENLDD